MLKKGVCPQFPSLSPTGSETIKGIISFCTVLLLFLSNYNHHDLVMADGQDAGVSALMFIQDGEPVECEKGKAYFSAKPPIVSRQEWNARDPQGEMKELKPQFITIHHTASAQKKDSPLCQKMKDLQRFSQDTAQLSTGKLKAAWPDIPYHYYIDLDGFIAEGRQLKYVGDTNTDYDPAGHILVVLEGNFEIERPTAAQMASLYELAGWLAAEWHIQPVNIKGHKDYTETQCPGKNLEDEIEKLQEYIRTSPSGDK